MYEIVSFISDYGISLAIILGMGNILFFLLKHKVLDSLLNKVGRSVSASEILTFNPIFSYLSNFLNNQIHMLSFSTKSVRDEVMRDMLICYASTIEAELKTLISADMKEWSSIRWKVEVEHAVSLIITNTRKNATVRGIPVEIQNLLFSGTSDLMRHLLDSVTLISNNYQIKSHLVKTDLALTLVHLYIVSTVGELTKYFESINGEISGIKYKDRVLE